MTTLNVFALAGAEAEPFREAGHSIEFVKCAGIYAAVERVDERPVVSEAALRAQHDIVVQVAARVDAVLPARFGSVVDIEELARLVTRGRDAIQKALELVRGRDQMTVRLFTAAVPSADPSGFTAATVGLSPPFDEVQGGPELIEGPDTTGGFNTGSGGRRGVSSSRPTATSGTAYLQKRRMAAAPVSPPGVASIAAAVRGLVVAERCEPGQGRIAATVYHLVDRVAAGRYREALETLQARLEGETLTVSGPWPPFAFVPDLWA